MSEFTRNALDLLRILIFETFGLGLLFHAASGDPSMDIHEPGIFMLILAMGLLVGTWLLIVDVCLGNLFIHGLKAVARGLRLTYGFIKTNFKNIG